MLQDLEHVPEVLCSQHGPPRQILGQVDLKGSLVLPRLLLLLLFLLLLLSLLLPGLHFLLFWAEPDLLKLLVLRVEGLGSRGLDTWALSFHFATHYRIVVISFPRASLIEGVSTFGLHCDIVEGAEGVIGGESMFFGMMDGRGIVRLGGEGLFVLQVRVIVLLHFPHDLQEPAGPLGEKLCLLVGPVFICLDDSLHHLFLGAVQQDDVGVS